MTAAMAWQDIKSRFVDDPGAALAAADDLVRRAIEERLQRFQQELEELRRDPPDAEAPTSTEEMRQRLVRYQAYFERLVHPTTH